MTLEELRAEVERRVQAALPARLLDAGVVYHSRRKGMHRRCECSYCTARQWTTSYVGNAWTSHPRRVYDYRSAYDDPNYELRKNAYALRRRDARLILKEFKERVFTVDMPSEA